MAGRMPTPALLGLLWGAGRRKPGDREEAPDGEERLEKMRAAPGCGAGGCGWQVSWGLNGFLRGQGQP